MFAHINRRQSSNLTQKTYCRKARINPSDFAYWLTRFKEHIKLDPAPASFIPVSLQEPEEIVSDRIIVTKPSGMEIFFLARITPSP
jgi:hypothetical protein